MGKRHNIYGGDYPLTNYGDYAQAAQARDLGRMNQEYLIWYRRASYNGWEFRKQRASSCQDALACASIPRDATAFVTRVIDTKKFTPKQDAFPWIESSP